jgi:hypothetical protein
MYNSAKFVSDMLNAEEVTSDVVITIDGNTIDATVVAYNPKVVFIEGIWVLPSKFTELMALPRHAGRKWVVRVHSDVPFIATEGPAMERIFGYLAAGVTVACNSERIREDIKLCASLMGYTDDELDELLPLLMNYYPTNFEPLPSHPHNYTQQDTLDIACFGAMRPMKNHLQQAMAAIRLVKQTGQKLRFHVNTRIDQGGAPPFKNIHDLFAVLPSDQFTLVTHEWQSHEDFLTTMAGIDILMQVSFSETFNIVAADATFVGRPLVTSAEIDWSYPIYADPTDVHDITKVLSMVRANPTFFVQNTRQTLLRYLDRSRRRWLDYMDQFED